MKERFFILMVLLSCTFVPSIAQTDRDSADILHVPVFYPEINPESPIGIFSLDFPLYFPAEKPEKHQLSISYTMGNIWHPQSRFLYPQNLTNEQRNELADIYMTKRPDYFEATGIETKDKLFHSDGVIKHFKLTYLNTWTSKHSLILNFNLLYLSGGRSGFNYFVSDNFIETFHTNFAIEDNYGRRLYPFNKASVQFDDEDGKSFRIDDNTLFTSVIDAHYYRQVFTSKRSAFHFDSQVGGHLSIPINQLHPYLIPGLSAGVRMDFSMGKKSSFTYTLDGGVTDQLFLKVGKGVRAIDWRYRKHARTFFGFNFQSKKKNTTVIGMVVNYQDPLLKGYYFTWNQTGYNEIGIEVLDEGDIWEGEVISRQFFLSKLTPAALYYFSLKTYFVLGFHKNGHEFNVYGGEDMFSFNNAPDIQFSFQYRFSPFGKKRLRR